MLGPVLTPTAFEETLRRAIIEGSDINVPTVPVRELRDLYAGVCARSAKPVPAALLEALQITTEQVATGTEIPASGPLIVVANHPFGFLDGAVLLNVVTSFRPDVRLLANRVLRCIPGLEEHCIFVDPFENANPSSNGAALRAALRWVRGGGVLATFPAGEVSHLNFQQGGVVDPEWSVTAAWIARRAECDIVPVYFDGCNSLPFHLLGLVHPLLRTLQLPRELLKKRGKKVCFGIGHPVKWKEVQQFEDERAITQAARWRTYSVANRIEHRDPKKLKKAQWPIADQVSRSRVEAELQVLRFDGGLVDEIGDFELFLMRGGRLPAVLHEIGRTREQAFRAADEGTGSALDLDEFDKYYDHLVLWHKKDRTIAGGYRLACTDGVIRRDGIRGLYTSTLFHYKPEFFAAAGPAIELGRSFVAPQYQKQFSPLFLLWRGIGEYVARSVGATVLMGAVSISRGYTEKSRELITRYFDLQHNSDPLRRLVRPRCVHHSRKLLPWEAMFLCQVPDVDSLSREVAQLEPDRKGVPVLIRQYTSLGGRMLCFSRDERFSNVLDGLVIVDLRQADRAVLVKYLGRHRLERILKSSAHS
jgi:putative hemolysin